MAVGKKLPVTIIGLLNNPSASSQTDDDIVNVLCVDAAVSYTTSYEFRSACDNVCNDSRATRE